jgi:signal peptidase I
VSRPRQWIFGRNPRRTTIRIAVFALVSFALFRWVLLPVRTDGISMQPTYESGQLKLVNRLAYAWGRPQRGDVVAVRLAGERVVFIKRIVGLPGERVAIRGGVVYINDRPLAEPYVRYLRPWERDEVVVGPRHYFLIGDNRGMNAADHTFGQVNASRVVGKVLF